MNEARALSIRGKLIAGFSIILTLFLLMLSAVLVTLYKSSSYSEDVVSIHIPVQHAAVDLVSTVAEMNMAYAKWIATRDNKYSRDIEDIMSRIKIIENKIDSDKGEAFGNDNEWMWSNIKRNLDQFYLFKEKIESIMSESNPDKATALISLWVGQILPLSEKINLLLNNDRHGGVVIGLIDMQSDMLQQGVDGLVKSNRVLEQYIITMIALIFLVTWVVVYVTSNKITLPLSEAIEAAKKIASGERRVNLTYRVQDETGLLIDSLGKMQKSIRDGEESLRLKELETRKLLENVMSTAKRFSIHSANVASGDLRERIKLNDDDNEIMARLGKELNSMTDGLSVMTRQIMETSHNMVATIDEVRRAIEVQSSGATEQAASINEITASLGEIEKSTSQTIDKARALGKAAKKTQEKGNLGLNSVEESVNGMKLVRDKVQIIAQTILDLSKQTQQVGEITGVVNNLAQQSKMLALNASIEAAKAGESGKGFAVVAAEVKNLAEQSEQSTAQVQKILEDIRHSTEKAVMVTEEGTKGVDHGMSLVEQAGDIIRNLNDVIHEATIASQQIEAAITQEGVGIEQITAGMNEINKVTSSLVKSITQSNEAMEDLSNIAKKLKNSVDIYKV